MFEKKEFRKTFQPNRDEVIGQFRVLRNKGQATFGKGGENKNAMIGWMRNSHGVGKKFEQFWKGNLSKLYYQIIIWL
jgi:hypothetical protein